MRVWAIGATNVRRMLRERSNIFFVFIFPIAIILLIGAQFGGDFEPTIGLYLADDGEISSSIAADLEATDEVEILLLEDEEDLFRRVERGSVQAGLSLPSELDRTAAAGASVEIGFVTRTDGFGPQLQAIIASSVADVMRPVGAAQFASVEAAVPYVDALEAATSLSPEIARIDVEVEALGDALFPSTLGRFDLGAASQLVLFTFLTALAGSAALILTRQLGVSQRMLASPTSIRAIVVGESAGRFGVAVVQGVYIVALTLIIFGVNWGDPIGAALLLVVFSAVAAGAGVLVGATFSNDQQAGGVSVMLSLGLAALGGCMLPIELFSPTMQNVAHVTPHAWAMDGFAELVRRGGGPGDILTELGVLGIYAVVLFALASWRLRVVITRP